MVFLIFNFVSMLCLVLSVAVFVLVERKVLGGAQLRQGPNKVGFMGILQPISDALKLELKEWIFPSKVNKLFYLVGPMIMFFLSLFLWVVAPYNSSLFYLKWGGLFFLCVSSLKVYGLIIGGWASNSKYAMLGTVRAIAQMISYEISMGFVILFPMVLTFSLGFMEVLNFQCFLPVGGFALPIVFMWGVSILAESQRSPMDLAEGESELVSGYNVEYGGFGFTCIFLGEYLSLLFIITISIGLFLGFYIKFFMAFWVVFLSWVSVWIRASFPRMRYDSLMGLMWKIHCPVSIGMLGLCSCLSML